MEEIGRAEKGFGVGRDQDCLGVGEGAMVEEVTERGGGHTGEPTRRAYPRSNSLGKRKGLIFLSSCNRWGFKLGV